MAGYGAIPLKPFLSFPIVDSTPMPKADTTPMPLTTTSIPFAVGSYFLLAMIYSAKAFTEVNIAFASCGFAIFTP